jgi:hypothetical protein
MSRPSNVARRRERSRGEKSMTVAVIVFAVVEAVFIAWLIVSKRLS